MGWSADVLTQGPRAHLAEDGGYQLFYQANDGILVHEGHLHIQL